jgi:RNA polymerase sigma-70 factor (ECF subfamily)
MLIPDAGPERDAWWIAGVQLHNEAVFNHLFQCFGSMLVRFACSLECDAEAAEDMVQDMFIKLWRLGHAWQPEKSVRAYLFGAIRLGVVSFKRGVDRDRSWMARAAHILTDISWGATEPVEPRVGADLLDVAVQNAVAKLSPRQRDCLWLTVVDDLSYQEVSDRLGISRETVRVMIKRAFAMMRKMLRAYTRGKVPIVPRKRTRHTDTMCARGHPIVEGSWSVARGHFRCTVCSRENNRRQYERNRPKRAARRRLLGLLPLRSATYCRHGHRLTPENTRKDNRGRDVCIACSSRAQRQYRRRRKELQQEVG